MYVDVGELILTVILKIHVYPFLVVLVFLDIIVRYIVALCPYKFPLKTNKAFFW